VGSAGISMDSLNDTMRPVRLRITKTSPVPPPKAFECAAI
jgi:hypothetical protein